MYWYLSHRGFKYEIAKSKEGESKNKERNNLKNKVTISKNNFPLTFNINILKFIKALKGHYQDNFTQTITLEK